MKKYDNAEDYAKVLIGNIREINSTLPKEEQPMPLEALDILEEMIYIACNNSFIEWLKGDRETMMLTDEELKFFFIEATKKYTERVLSDMVMDGLVSMSVGEGGEILYSLSEKGERAAKRYEEGYDD